MGRTFPSFLFLICCFTSWCQQEVYRFKNIGIDDGLSQNSVISIAQDSLGFMWFATQDGLNRYDGNEFKIFPVSFDDITNPENTILGKLLVHGNKLWMIAKGGNLQVMDLEKETIVQKSHFGGSGNELPKIRSLFIENENRIWLGTENEGIFIVDADFKIVNRLSKNAAEGEKISSNRINGIFRDSRNNFWILTDKGANLLTEGKLKKLYLKDLNTSSIVENSEGQIFLGTYGNGLYTKERRDRIFHPASNEKAKIQIPQNLTVETLQFDFEGDLWIGTYGDGVYLLDKDNEVSHFLPDRNRPNSIGFQDILSLERDRTGGIWIGTDGGGVSFFHDSFRIFKQIDQSHVPSSIAIEQIRAIETVDNERLFLGTSGNGLTIGDISKNDFQTVHFKPYKPGVKNHDRVLALHYDGRQNIWIGTHGNGTILMDKDSGKIRRWFTEDSAEKKSNLPSNSMNAFLAAENGRVWAGSRGAGLLLLDPDEGLVKKYCGGNAEEHEITALAKVGDSALALGHKKRGIKILNIETGMIRPILQDFISKNLGELEVKSLFYADEWLWVGTAGKGIIVTNLTSGDTKLFTKEDGLPNSMIYGMLREEPGKLWISSNFGLFRLTYNHNKEAISIQRIASFTKENGLQSNEFNTGAFHKADDGTMYFGGIEGLNYFDPGEIPDRRNDLRVVISEAMVDNVPIESPHNITYTSRLKLPHHQNSVAFAYTALNFVSPEQFNYSYKLEGYDENWIQAGNRKYTAYTNLPAGDYVFKVKLSEKNFEDAPVTELGILIATPFWRTWWFILLVTLAFGGFLYLIYWGRVKQLVELQQVKDNISADLHDDLGSRLTTIHLLSAIAKPKLGGDSETAKVLEKIDREIYASSEALDEIVWNIRITDEDLSDIIAKIRRYVSEVLENHNLEYHIEAEDNFGSFSMGMQKRRELFLMSKELINNVRKHSNATKVEMQISRDGDRLYILVKDNGKGFDPVKQTNRNGILNLKNRIKKWNGQFNIASKCDRGTKIEIWIPFDRPGFFQKLLSFSRSGRKA